MVAMAGVSVNRTHSLRPFRNLTYELGATIIDSMSTMVLKLPTLNPMPPLINEPAFCS
jgi:hypothetical protein